MRAASRGLPPGPLQADGHVFVTVPPIRDASGQNLTTGANNRQSSTKSLFIPQPKNHDLALDDKPRFPVLALNRTYQDILGSQRDGQRWSGPQYAGGGQAVESTGDYPR